MKRRRRPAPAAVTSIVAKQVASVCSRQWCLVNASLLLLLFSINPLSSVDARGVPENRTNTSSTDALEETNATTAPSQSTTIPALDPSSFDYFDQLRQHPHVQVAHDIEEGSSSILQVTDPDTQQVYRLAELKCFLPLTSAGKEVRPRALDDAFTLLLAMDHFNHHAAAQSRSPGIFATDELQAEPCNVRLTAEIVDTELSTVAATYSYVNRLPIERQATETTTLDTAGEEPSLSLPRNHPSITNPPIAAVVGGWRSAVSAPLAILSGVAATPQVSWGSTALDFDDKGQYPYFGRTITSTYGEAKAALRFFQSIGSTHVAILYVTDQFGSSLQKSFADAAAAAGIQTASIGVSYDIVRGGEEVQQVMKQLQAYQYRHTYCIIFDAQFEAIAEEADKFGLVGPDYLYAIHGPDAVDMQWAASQGTSTYPDSVVKFLHGAGIVQPMGGLGGFENDLNLLESDMGYHHLFLVWRHTLKNNAFRDYVTSKLPASLDNTTGFDRENVLYTRDPGAYRPFLYDAIFALGVSMCRAGKSKNFFDGPSIMNEFRQINSTGASGFVVIDNVTGTRDYQSVTFVMWNVVNESNKGLQFRPSARLLETGLVQLPGSEFRFADGSLNPPANLPAIEEDLNYIGKEARILGYGLAGLTASVALAFLVWLFVNRASRVVYAAQPLFLVLVAVGSIVSVSSLIPLSAEETVVSSSAGLDFACMASPWLYFMGSNITLSALISKTFKVYQAYCDPSMEYIQVNVSDIFKVLVSLLVVSGSVLTLWTVIAPLEWTRTYRGNTDIFLRLTDSYGECRGDSTLFAALLLAINFFFLILGSWQAAITRHVETEYKESQFVNLSLFSILQAWMMGIAILAVTYDDPQARFYVMTGIIFVTSACSLSFVFAPKILALRADIKTRGKNAYLERHRFSGKLRPPREGRVHLDAGSVGGDSRDQRSHASSDSEPLNEGAKVLHNPKATKNLIAAGGRAMSRAQLQQIELAKSQEIHGMDQLEEQRENSKTSPRRRTDQDDILQYLEDSTGSFAMAGDESNEAPRHPETVEEGIEESSSRLDETDSALWSNLKHYIGKSTGQPNRGDDCMRQEKEEEKQTKNQEGGSAEEQHDSTKDVDLDALHEQCTASNTSSSATGSVPNEVIAGDSEEDQIPERSTGEENIPSLDKSSTNHVN